MTDYYYGGSWNSLSFSPTLKAPAVGPKVTFGSVRTKAGYIGQVLVDSVIAWETKPRKTAAKAEAKARARYTDRIVNLLED